MIQNCLSWDQTPTNSLALLAHIVRVYSYKNWHKKSISLFQVNKIWERFFILFLGFINWYSPGLQFNRGGVSPVIISSWEVQSTGCITNHSLIQIQQLLGQGCEPGMPERGWEKSCKEKNLKKIQHLMNKNIQITFLPAPPSFISINAPGFPNLLYYTQPPKLSALLPPMSLPTTLDPY